MRPAAWDTKPTVSEYRVGSHHQGYESTCTRTVVGCRCQLSVPVARCQLAGDQLWVFAEPLPWPVKEVEFCFRVAMNHPLLWRNLRVRQRTSAVGAKEDSPAFQGWVGVMVRAESSGTADDSPPTLSPKAGEKDGAPGKPQIPSARSGQAPRPLGRWPRRSG
jgi:hypothetical protein